MTDLQNDSMYGAVLRHETATIRISLGRSVMNPHTNLTEMEILNLQELLNKLADRDISISVTGWKFDGFISAASIDFLGNQPVLQTTVQF
jgi:hypothetical protein